MCQDNGISCDSLFDGGLHCLQHKKGYRFSVDAVLLANFLTPKTGARVLDLGAGCGVISLILAQKFANIHLTALEIQKSLIRLICKNISLNGFHEKIVLLPGDFRKIREFLPVESFDHIVCNPPYFQQGTGRLNPVDEASVARHEIQATMIDVVAAATYSLRNRGKASFIYPASRTAGLLTCLKKYKLEPKKIQFVYSYPGASAKLVLLETMKNGGEELEVLPPFYIFKEPGGEHSDEMASCYA